MDKNKNFILMIIPSSKKKVFKIYLTISKFLFIIISFFSIIIIFWFFGFFYFKNDYQNKIENYKLKEDNNTQIKKLNKIYDSYQNSLNILLNQIDKKKDDKIKLPSANTSDIMNMNSFKETSQFQTDLTILESTLKENINSLSKIVKTYKKNKELLSDLPCFWPVKNESILSSDFKSLDLGISIIGLSNSVVVASANGKIIDIDIDQKDGLYITIQHKYGFKTKYLHLSDSIVDLNQKVIQGQEIAHIGNSGEGFNTRLEFLIIIGDTIVDPMQYLNYFQDYKDINNE